MSNTLAIEYSKTLPALVEARAEIVRLKKRKDECSNGWDGALATVQRLERELAEAKTDAERYRWLRERHENTVMDIYNSISAMKPELLDAAIDAAMKEGGK